MYDSFATLIGYGTPTYDQYGNEENIRTERKVYVQPRGVYQSEFYNAAQNGLKPSLTLYIANKSEYHGETLLTYQGRDYSVIRVDWNAQRDGVSLICEERIGNED